MEKKGPAVASTVIGQGNTTAWKLCGLDKDTCLTVFFDISSSEKSDASGNVNPQLYIQTVTSYQNIDGESKLRVTTITRRWLETSVMIELLHRGPVDLGASVFNISSFGQIRNYAFERSDIDCYERFYSSRLSMIHHFL